MNKKVCLVLLVILFLSVLYIPGIRVRGNTLQADKVMWGFWVGDTCLRSFLIIDCFMKIPEK